MTTISLIGDSISLHYEPYLRQYLENSVRFIREESGVLQSDETLPGGANAGDSRMVLRLVQEKLSRDALRSDLMLVNAGLHDMKRNQETSSLTVPLQHYENNLKALIRLIDESKRHMVWVRTTPCDERIHNRSDIPFLRYAADCLQYNQAADAIMNNAGVACIDLYGFTLALGPNLYADHVHFFHHIRQKQAAFIAGWLHAWLQKK